MAEEGQLDAKYLNFGFSNVIIKDIRSYVRSGDTSNDAFLKAYIDYDSYYYKVLRISFSSDKIIDFDNKSYNNLFTTIQYWINQDRHPLEIWCASNLIDHLHKYIYDGKFALNFEAEVTKKKSELKKLSLKLADCKLSEYVSILYISCAMDMIEVDDRVSLEKILRVIAKMKNLNDSSKEYIQRLLERKNILVDTDEEEK
jgi:hypothetical protein